MEWAELFVSSYLFASLCVLAQNLGVPSAVTTFAHNAVLSVSYLRRVSAPAGAPAWMRCWNRMLWKLANRLFSWKINQIVGEVTERKGIGRTENFLLSLRTE